MNSGRERMNQRTQAQWWAGLLRIVRLPTPFDGVGATSVTKPERIMLTDEVPIWVNNMIMTTDDQLDLQGVMAARRDK